MTVLVGRDQAEAPRSLPSRRSDLAAGVLRPGAELVEGMHVQLGDGRWAVVAGEPATVSGGRVSVPVLTWPDLVEETADEVEPERLLVGWGVRVRTRTPAEERAYVEAVYAADDEEEGL